MTTANDNLFKVTEPEYGETYRADYLTMYQDYVASADRISERRHAANSFFLSVNTGLLGVTGYFSSGDTKLIWLAALGGVILSGTWWLLLRSYRSLNTAKFNVIHELEQRLPFSAYDEEWVHLKSGLDKSVHIPFSAVESIVPVVFVLLHTFVFLVNIYICGKSLCLGVVA